MSRIIKSNDLVLKEPVTIDHLFEETKQKILQAEEATLQNALHDVIEASAHLHQHHSDSSKVRDEADKIIHETEEMIVEILDKARSEAMAIISDAREEAQELHNAALEEINNFREQSISQGYQEGWQRAVQENEETRTRAIAESERMIDEALKERLSILNSSEETMVRLVMAISRKIIEKEVEQNPDIIVNLVRNALDLLSDAETVKVLVSPRDFEILVQEKVNLTTPGQGTSTVNLQSDPRVAAGGCVVESDMGLVDARLETRISNIENTLLEVAGRDQ
ncbi:MAG: FliH/SctL family protein [Acidobacteriota bacterium]